MKLAGVELRRALPLVTPFRTSFGVERDRDVLLVRAADDAEGWGSAWPRPSPATPRSTPTAPPTCCAASWSRRPRPDLDPEAVGRATAFVKGHRMAKAALELAVLDAWLRAAGQPLAGFLATTRDRVRPGSRWGSWSPCPSCWTPWPATWTRGTCGSS